MSISWTREQIKEADKTGKDLFAVGYQDKSVRGTAQGFMPAGTAGKLFMFASRLSKCKDPLEAFKYAWPDLAEKL